MSTVCDSPLLTGLKTEWPRHVITASPVGIKPYFLVGKLVRHRPACVGLRSEVVISSAAVYAKLTFDGSRVSMRTFGICQHGSVGRAALRGTLSSKDASARFHAMILL